jgi:hypothetical protein
MKRFDYRILVGAVLVLLGTLMLLDTSGILKGATGYVWSGILVLGGGTFLYWFFRDSQKWWAAIPGFTLLGMGASALLLDKIGWGGLAFLGGISLGFWAIYITRREMWWAIIPGGVLMTLGLTSALGSVYGILHTGGIFLVGLGITFLLVALLAGRRWAYIPASILLLSGFLLGTPFEGIMDYVWIGLLLVVGIVMIVTTLVKKE